MEFGKEYVDAQIQKAIEIAKKYEAHLSKFSKEQLLYRHLNIAREYFMEMRTIHEKRTANLLDKFQNDPDYSEIKKTCDELSKRIEWRLVEISHLIIDVITNYDPTAEDEEFIRRRGLNE